MPYMKFGVLIAAVLVVIAVVLGTTYFGGDTEGPSNIDYVITSVADGTYAGELPPLDREPVFSDSFPEAARASVRQHIENETAQLAAHPEDGNAWMSLALWYHTANDFEAARRVWEFLVEVTPANYTVLNNLGRLYHYSTPDFPKAEGYFLRARDANPAREDAYIELFDLYRYSYKKDTSAAADIMHDAIEKFPDNIGLIAALGSYYRDAGQQAKARVEFERALQKARAVSDLNLITTLNDELSKLP